MTSHVEIILVSVCRWEELISLTKQRKQLLKGAEQVHKFVRDASETNDRMNEKVGLSYTVPMSINIHLS